MHMYNCTIVRWLQQYTFIFLHVAHTLLRESDKHIHYVGFTLIICTHMWFGCCVTLGHRRDYLQLIRYALPAIPYVVCMIIIINDRRNDYINWKYVKFTDEDDGRLCRTRTFNISSVHIVFERCICARINIYTNICLYWHNCCRDAKMKKYTRRNVTHESTRAA